MKRILLFLMLFVANTQFCLAYSIDIRPQAPIQGEPVMVQIKDIKLSQIKSLSFDGTELKVFNFNSMPTSLIGIDLNKKPGNYEIKLILNNGSTTKSNLNIKQREKYEAPLAVPDKLGGNSPENQTKVVSQLTKENNILANIFTGKKSFWTKPFQYPIKNPIITDSYGYSRLTGAYTITHKGVDFRAEKGTRVVAMNRGVVRMARTFTVYGKTVVVDHGLGVMTFYMHLSKIYVNVGELVLPGQLVGLSGDTGYAESPHLHTTVRINNISIDPIKFLELF